LQTHLRILGQTHALGDGLNCRFHLRSLYEKLGVGCRVLAVAVAREKGIISA